MTKNARRKKPPQNHDATPEIDPPNQLDSWIAEEIARVIGADVENVAPVAACLADAKSADEARELLAGLTLGGAAEESSALADEYVRRRFEPEPETDVFAVPGRGDGTDLTAADKRRLAKQAGVSLREWETRALAAEPAKRRTCGCAATRHALLANCLACGRIHCTVEGPGACAFCGNYVESAKQQRDRWARGMLTTPQAPRPWRIAAPAADDEAALAAAEARLQRLLAFQKDAAERTTVTDEASQFDYAGAAEDPWLAPEERAALLREHELRDAAAAAGRRQQVLTLDVAQRRLVVAPDAAAAPESVDAVLRRARAERLVARPAAAAGPAAAGAPSGGTGVFANPQLRHRPQYVPADADEADVADERAAGLDGIVVAARARGGPDGSPDLTLVRTQKAQTARALAHTLRRFRHDMRRVQYDAEDLDDI